MTAEIAILNKLAVTLAADSAVTLSVGGTQKVYNSADKIFEATNHDPIGIMVYNNPEFQGIPIEASIKIFRDQKCHSHFDTVFSFAESFLSYLESIEAPTLTIEEAIFGSLVHKMDSLRELYNRAGSRVIDELSELPEEDTTGEKILAKMESEVFLALTQELLILQERSTPEWANGLDEAAVQAAHGETIDQLISIVFGDIQLSQSALDRIKSISALCLLKDYQHEQLTGLVFAGFGKSEIFPSLVSYAIYGVIAGKLKYRFDRKFDVDRKLVPVATVIPFAQQEMVDRFMYGMDQQFLDLCDRYFDGALSSLRLQIEGVAATMDEPVATALKEAVENSLEGIMEEFRRKLVPDHLSSSEAKFSDIIRSMPKQELAALSESLVQITSLKRKFSADAESVGGPIDVAMITRAEGFVWVKRKHFFEPELNPRYFFRRYGSTSPAKGADQEGSE